MRIRTNTTDAIQVPAGALVSFAVVTGQVRASFTTLDALGGTVVHALVGATVFVEWDGTRFYNPSGPAALTTVTGSGGVYRHGRLEMGVVGGLVNAINLVRLHDEYLYGIGEMPSSWAPAALDAQATIARGYALANMGSLKSDCACNVYDSVKSQHFTGWSKENETIGTTNWGLRWKAAVDRTSVGTTQGNVVEYNGALATTYYYSSSGGRTQNSEDVWVATVPYLRSVDDHWSLDPANNPTYASWTRSVTQAAMAAAFGLTDVVSVDLSSRTAGGGVAAAVATSSTGATATISGEVLRSRLALPATWVSRPALRVAGVDRWSTSVAVAKLASPSGKTVVIVSGQDANLVDGLVAGPLAHSVGGPVLLVGQSIPAVVSAELTRRGADHAIIVGGAGAVPDSVATSLGALGLTVERISGVDRYATAAKVALRVGSGSMTAIVASGEPGSLGGRALGFRAGIRSGTSNPIGATRLGASRNLGRPSDAGRHRLHLYRRNRGDLRGGQDCTAGVLAGGWRRPLWHRGGRLRRLPRPCSGDGSDRDRRARRQPRGRARGRVVVPPHPAGAPLGTTGERGRVAAEDARDHPPRRCRRHRRGVGTRHTGDAERVKVLSIVGARPQFVKLAPIAEALTAGGHEHVIVHTGQHYDANMSDVFFQDLAIPAPDVHLGVGSGSHGVQTGAMLSALDGVLDEHRPDWVLVYGDTNSTIAGALSAVKMHLPLAHLEAGLRSFNRRMPEEHNRVLTDHAADLCLAPTQVAIDHLTHEGLGERSVLVGDVMTDVCLRIAAQVRDVPPPLPEGVDGTQDYLVSTIHRAENTDDPSRLRAVIDALAALPVPVVLLAHPRLVARAAAAGIDLRAGALRTTAPLGYPQMVAAVLHSRGRRHRLRRAAEGGLPARGPLHHAAHRDRVDRDRGPGLERPSPAGR